MDNLEIIHDGLYALLGMRELEARRWADEYRSGLKKQPWSVVPASKLKRVWRETAKLGFVRDERGLDQIVATITRNIVRLWINSNLIVGTHDEVKNTLEELGLQEDMYDSPLGDYVGSRVTEIGLDKLLPLGGQLLLATDPMERLVLVDRILNVAHWYSDLSLNFVEGGSRTLSELSSADGTKTNPGSQPPASADKMDGDTFGMRQDTFISRLRRQMKKPLSELVESSIRQNPGTYSSSHVARYVRRTDQTRDRRWVRQLVDWVNYYPRWELVYIPTEKLNIEVEEDDARALLYASMGAASIAPVIVMPSQLGLEIIEGDYRAAAAETLGIPVPAYAPRGWDMITDKGYSADAAEYLGLPDVGSIHSGYRVRRR